MPQLPSCPSCVPPCRHPPARQHPAVCGCGVHVLTAFGLSAMHEKRRQLLLRQALSASHVHTSAHHRTPLLHASFPPFPFVPPSLPSRPSFLPYPLSSFNSLPPPPFLPSFDILSSFSIRASASLHPPSYPLYLLSSLPALTSYPSSLPSLASSVPSLINFLPSVAFPLPPFLPSSSILSSCNIVPFLPSSLPSKSFPSSLLPPFSSHLYPPTFTPSFSILPFCRALLLSVSFPTHTR